MTQRTKPAPPDLLSPREAAAIAGVTVRTMNRYADDGRVTFIRLPSGHRRYHRESVEALVGRSAA